MLVIRPGSGTSVLQPGRVHAVLTEEADAVADENGRDMDEDLVHNP